MMNRLSALKDRASYFFLRDFRTVGWTYFTILFGATLLQYFIHYDVGEGVLQLRYNNFLIFRQSFFHLLEGKDLYILYPSEHWDLFKYSPTFALLMAPMAVVPDLPGLILWNALNAGLLYYALKTFPIREAKIRIIMLWFILQDLLTTTQGSQSNALMAALLILAFTSFETKKVALAALFIVLGFYVKIFALAGASLFLLYPRKLAFLGYLALWMVVLLLLPLLVTAPDLLVVQYRSWFHLLSEDHSASLGYSVMGWLKAWFGIDWPKHFTVLAGIALFCLPFTRVKKFNELGFRILFLSSVLIWIVIFNHKAESSTFLIAMCGVGLWYFTQQRTGINLALVILAFVFTTLSPTDIFPGYVKQVWVVPYVLKAVFCIFIWFKIIYELITGSYYQTAVTSNQD